MSMIRPEARAALWRWREIFAAGLVILWGLRWALTSFGIVKGLGWVLVILGAGLLIAAFQRLRFRQGGGGPGIVTIEERRVVYFGPDSGGVLDMDSLHMLQLNPAPALTWELRDDGNNQLNIPINAEGADALFDLFVALPGIKTEAMLDALRHPPQTRVTIWKSPRYRLPGE